MKKDGKAHSSSSLRCHIFLIGFMGAGKSTVGRLLGQKLGVPVVELDQRIEKMQHMTVSQIFEERGEPYFRQLEEIALESCSADQPSVVSCGGGTALFASNRKWMKQQGKVILLEASPETIALRLANCQDRPLLKEKKDTYIRELMEQRRPAYTEAADWTVNTDPRTAEQVCDTICDLLLSHNLSKGCPEAKTEEFPDLKKAGIVTGAVIGGVVGGTISVAGRLLKNPFVEEIGQSVADSGVLTGAIAGNAVSGAAHVVAGTVGSKPKNVKKGVFELKKSGNQVVGNVTDSVKTVVSEGGHIAQAARDKDMEGVKKGIRKLGKIVAVQLLTVGALDIEEKKENTTKSKE